MELQKVPSQVHIVSSKHPSKEVKIPQSGNLETLIPLSMKIPLINALLENTQKYICSTFES